MPYSPTALADAYRALDLEQDVSLDAVRAKYKQIALRTHPDKNPNNPDATAQFQRVGEAYSIIEKHLTAPEPRFRTGRCDCPKCSGMDDFDDFDDDDDYMDAELDFYVFLFEAFMRGGTGFSRSQFRHEQRRPKPPPETREQYNKRVREARQEQIAAEQRRKEQAAARKLRQEDEREKERLVAEERRKAKIQEKKDEVANEKKKAQKIIKNQNQRAQDLRSAVFAAARSGEVEKVKTGIWENEVDAAGGEIKPGCEALIKSPPEDPNETILHIAARRGDRELVEWLEAHNADAEERNSNGMTAFHIALSFGKEDIVNYFLEEHPTKDSDNNAIYQSPEGKSNLALAIHSGEPQLVYLVLENSLSDPQDITDSWAWVTSAEGKAMVIESVQKASPDEPEKAGDIVKLLMRAGNFTPPATPVMQKKTAPFDPERQKKTTSSFRQKYTLTGSSAWWQRKGRKRTRRKRQRWKRQRPARSWIRIGQTLIAL